jgi:hypothetical protein
MHTLVKSESFSIIFYLWLIATKVFFLSMLLKKSKNNITLCYFWLQLTKYKVKQHMKMKVKRLRGQQFCMIRTTRATRLPIIQAKESTK